MSSSAKAKTNIFSTVETTDAANEEESGYLDEFECPHYTEEPRRI